MEIYPMISAQIRSAYTELSYGNPILEVIKAIPLETSQDIAAAVCLMHNIESDVAAVYYKIGKLKGIHDGLRSIYEILREQIHDAVKNVGDVRETVGDMEVRAWVTKSPLRVDIVDESLVPAQFIKQVISIQKDKILEHFRKTGEVIPGIEIVTDNTHLRVT